MDQDNAPASHGPRQCSCITWTNWLRVFPDILYCEDDTKHTDIVCRKKCLHIKAVGKNSNHHASDRKQLLTSITSILFSPVILVLSSPLVTTPVPTVVFISSLVSMLPITILHPIRYQSKVIKCNVCNQSASCNLKYSVQGTMYDL